jgi:hypothetical protein
LRKFVEETGIQPRVSFEEARIDMHGCEQAQLYQNPEGLV